MNKIYHQKIPMVNLNMDSHLNSSPNAKLIFENEIQGIQVEHFKIAAGNELIISKEEGIKTMYLFIKGGGKILAENATFELSPETIFLPNTISKFTIIASSQDSLHYLQIKSKLSKEDLLDVKDFPSENTQQVYCVKFEDCPSYSETIKSPNTISRTILPNKYIPRIAMGTVYTKGPDKVAAHKHPMLEQLFLGLSKNNCTVHADDAQVAFPEFALLHIPLGSTHSVVVEKEKDMHYVWMDFFLNREGEEWLKTHKVNEDKSDKL